MKSKKPTYRLPLLLVGLASSAAVCAQTITTPPRPISAVQETPGVDSTYQGNVQPNTSNSTITLNFAAAPAPAPPPAPPPVPPPPPPVTCTPSSSTIPVTQTASCPAGYMTNTGATSFTQSGTATVATTCPAGIYGSPATSTTNNNNWSPTPAAACPIAKLPNSLPINGGTYTAQVAVPEINGGTHPSGQAEIFFVAYNGGWEIYKQGYLIPLTVLASGGLPNEAVSVTYAMGAITQGGNKPATANNGAASRTTLTASQLTIDLQSAVVRGTSSDISEGTATVTVYFYNSLGTLISQTTFTFIVSSAGSA